jgi:hypothetical protein
MNGDESDLKFLCCCSYLIYCPVKGCNRAPAFPPSFEALRLATKMLGGRRHNQVCSENRTGMRKAFAR